MKHCTQISIHRRPVARTPRLLGVNVEVQDHADSTNLWDWLAHSLSGVVREFHPDRSLRRELVSQGRWGEISSRADYDGFRKAVRDDPAGGGIDWSNYLFGEKVPWIGVPDAIARKLSQLQIEPLYALGYGTRDFPRPVLRNGADLADVVNDDDIDWEAAVSAYDYYFAVIWHFASEYDGRRFMMVNEPENQGGWFHWPQDVAEAIEGGFGNWWTRLNWQEDDTTRRFRQSLASQYEVLARIARDAVEDVRSLLAGRGADRLDELKLSGPTNVLWQPLWQRAGRYLDTLDFHHYHTDAESFRSVFTAARAGVQEGQKLAISEFNRLSGGVSISENLFDLDNSLQMADLLMTVMSLAGSDGPGMDFATLYLLHFPSTHRNYKHLLYGDMNVVDWTGCDTPLWNRGEEWYPSADEMQIRFATPAFYLFRMLSRCAGAWQGRPGPHPVLPAGVCNPTSAGPGDIHAQLRTLAVDQGGRLIVTILNPGGPAENVRIDTSCLPGDYATCWVRETSQKRRDEPVCRIDLADGRFALDIPGRSMVQAIVMPPQGKAEKIEIREQSITPGGLAEGLALWQTTRLRAIAAIDGQPVDITDVGVVWESSKPDAVRVDGGGLVQRIRPCPGDVTMTAREFDGKAVAEVVIPGP